MLSVHSGDNDIVIRNICHHFENYCLTTSVPLWEGTIVETRLDTSNQITSEIVQLFQPMAITKLPNKQHIFCINIDCGYLLVNGYSNITNYFVSPLVKLHSYDLQALIG
jgi:hypothetical protein